MKPETLRIRKPTALPPELKGAPAFSLDRPIKGLKVGLRIDYMWPSWVLICKLWSERLRKDGAEPVVLRVGEHVGEAGMRTKAALEEWAGAVDCAVVGLAN